MHSNQWQTYFQLSNDEAYTHLTVHYDIHFADLTTDVRTQNMKNTWIRVKRQQKKQDNFSRTLLHIYL